MQNMKSVLDNKKGQLQSFNQLAVGIVLFAIIVVVGIVILANFGDNDAVTTADVEANNTIDQLILELGTTQGLGSWVPLVVVALVGFLLIGFFTRRA